MALAGDCDEGNSTTRQANVDQGLQPGGARPGLNIGL